MLIGKSGETIAEHSRQGMRTRNNRRGGMTRFRIAGMWGLLIARCCFRTFLPNAKLFRGRVWVMIRESIQMSLPENGQSD